MIILILSLPLGFAANYPDQTKKLISLTPVWIKMLHNSIGLFGYGIGILSLCLGYYTNWFIYYTGSESRLVATVLTVFVSLWPLNGAFVSLYYQIKALITWRGYSSKFRPWLNQNNVFWKMETSDEKNCKGDWTFRRITIELTNN